MKRVLKEFMRKTKRGSILKIVREHYLRTDLVCGSEVCAYCDQEERLPVLSKTPEIKNKTFPFPHYVVLDTNVILDQIDILEEDAICNVIVFTTVLDEVKHRSGTVYKRFHDIMHRSQRNFYVFVNEHHIDTYVERMREESTNDRNDRAIRVATKWYSDHLNKSQVNMPEKKKIRVILLTDDANNREKANQEEILTSSVEEYVQSLVDYPNLLDKISRKTYELTFTNKTGLFPPHLTPAQLHQGIKERSLLQGTFMASRENYLEGSVNVEGFEKNILIQGREHLNRAVDGDLVAIKLLPKEEWSAPSEIVLQEDEGDPGDILEPENEVLVAKLTKADEEILPTAIVVGIVRRNWGQYCGILEPNPIMGSTRHIFIPANRKIPKVRVETRQVERLHMNKIIVAIDSWPRYSRYPCGHFVRILGPIGDIETENEVVLIEHDVPHSKFSEEVLSFLPKLPWVITEEVFITLNIY